MPKITVNSRNELRTALRELMNGSYRLRVVCTGGRDFTDQGFVYTVLDCVKDLAHRYLFVGQGGARGLDTLVKNWSVGSRARTGANEQKTWPADWDKHGKAAGSIRNQLMLYEAQPDVVLAFPGGKGTADCVKKALKQGIPVIEILYNSEN